MHMRQFVHPNRKIRLKSFWIVEMDLNKKNSKFFIERFGNFYKYRMKEENQDREYRRIIRSKQSPSKNVVYNDGPHLE